MFDTALRGISIAPFGNSYRPCSFKGIFSRAFAVSFPGLTARKHAVGQLDDLCGERRLLSAARRAASLSCH